MLDSFIRAYRERIRRLERSSPDLPRRLVSTSSLESSRPAPTLLRLQVPSDELEDAEDRDVSDVSDVSWRNDDLEPFVAALRAQVEHQARWAPEEFGGPPAPSSDASAPRMRIWRWAIAGTVAAAACMLLTLPTLVDQARRAAEARTFDSAEHSTRRGAELPWTSSARSIERTPLRPTPQIPLLPLDDRSENSGPMLSAEPLATPIRGEHRKRLPTPLATLEQEAQTRWQAGDLEGAQTVLRHIIRRSGTSRASELAYADLFAVMRQLGGEAAQHETWQAYLQQFPRGRFADDVRASLCRRSSDREQTKCWGDYLQHHPKGAHAIEARGLQHSGGEPS